MTKVDVWLVVASVLFSWTNKTALAKDNISFEVTADFFGKYIWRGQNLVDDWVFQPGVSAGYKGFTASAWGNLDLTTENDKNGDFTEADLTLDYSGQFPGIEALGCSVGLIYYDFPVSGAADDTLELYWGLALDVPANPSVTFYHDVDEVDGTYILLGVGHSFEDVIEIAHDIPVGIDLAAGLGWGSSSYNKFYWGPDKSKLNDLALSASFPVKISGWTVAPSVNYVTLVGDDIRQSNVYGTDSDFFFVGVGISKAF
ncbi:MAG TPA: hypothetical protein VMX13_00645 [Sedimentisphaerales bacterium]|nr:hypothetical protein [Sedimentisphaerales bacterium]